MSIRQNVQRTIGRAFSGNKSDSSRLPGAVELENRALKETVMELMEALGAVVDALDSNTIDHSVKVGKYALALAHALGLPQGDQDRIFQAALVHDVGMILISSAVTRPGALTKEEMDLLRLHPTISGEIVGRIHYLRELAPMVHHHHERYDGTGYPDRLVGEEIPIGARILCLADSLDAMLTNRPNRPAHPLEDVMLEIQRCSGTQFDPLVVRAFFQLVAEKGRAFFVNTDEQASRDMLLSTVGISSGRARKILSEE